jgi:RND superfamily putative drug exporter
MAADLITRIPQRAARWSAEHPWRAILTWLVLVAAATSLAFLVPTHEAEPADYRIGQSGRAEAMAERAGLDAPDTEVVLLSGDRTAVPGAAREVARRMADVEGVGGVSPPVWNDDRTVMLVSVALTDGADDLAPLTEVTDAVAAEHPELTVRLTGGL